MAAFTGRTTAELVLLAQLGVVPSSKHTDGSMPQVFWVAKGGADGGNSGSFYDPCLTILGCIQQRVVDGRGDAAMIGPGQWAESPDIGSSTDSLMQKRDLWLIGSGGRHTGRTQIIGDGSSARATITVRSGYTRGFRLSNVELDTNALARPCLHLITSDTTASITANTNDYHALVDNVDVNSDGTPEAGILLEGATKMRFRNCSIAGCIFGVFLRGSANNFPDNLIFDDCRFWDNTTADVAGGTYAQLGGAAVTTALAVGTVNLTNVYFHYPKFLDRGGTPVTNYVNWQGLTVNCGFYEFVAARDVADGTLMQLPVDCIAIGRSAAAAEFIIGA